MEQARKRRLALREKGKQQRQKRNQRQNQKHQRQRRTSTNSTEPEAKYCIHWIIIQYVVKLIMKMISEARKHTSTTTISC